MRAVDPGVHRTYVSVDLGTGLDVRWSVKQLKTSAWHRRLRTWSIRNRTQQLQKRHATLLPTIRLYRKTQVANRLCKLEETKAEIRQFVGAEDCVRECYGDVTWTRLNATRWINRTRELEREAAKLAAPRPGSSKTLILWGAASKSGFHGIRGKKGPCTALVRAICERRRAVVVYCPEFRTSKLSHSGRLMVHPVETRPKRLLKPCRSRQCGYGVRGCKCFCSVKGCSEKRSKG